MGESNPTAPLQKYGITDVNPIHQHNTRNKYIKNYSFDFDFGQQWGSSSVTMTAVTGHLTNVEFPSEYKNWSHPPPESLFAAPILTNVHDVGVTHPIGGDAIIDQWHRTKRTSPRT